MTINHYTFNNRTDDEVFAELDSLLAAGDDEAFDAAWAAMSSGRIDRYQDRA